MENLDNKIKKIKKFGKDYMEKKSKNIGYEVELANWLDISYYIAFNLTILTIVMIYSMICPMVLLIGAIYFALAFNIDWYNVYYRYPKEFSGEADNFTWWFCRYIELTLIIQQGIFLFVTKNILHKDGHEIAFLYSLIAL